MYFKFGLILAGAWCFAAKSALAQQFPFIRTAYEALGLTQPCFEALNTTVECSDRLARHIVWDSSSVDLLNQNALAEVCQDACRQSLVDLRTTISDSCDAALDVIHYGYMTYPATYIADRYLYFYDVSCYRDKSSGELCDAVVGRWRNETGGAAAHQCEDCWLGPMAVQLGSPIGHDEERASVFASLTSSCAVDIYAVASPTPYGEVDSTVSLVGSSATAATAPTAATAETAATAGKVPIPVETPMIYPLLEIGTAASAGQEIELDS